MGNLAGDLEHITEHETPPITPLSAHNMSPSFSSTREARKSVSSISSVKQQKKGMSGGVSESFDMMYVGLSRKLNIFRFIYLGYLMILFI